MKGNVNVGEKINGKTKKEEPRAVCPVHLEQGADYLLSLTRTIHGYRLSRFSFPVKKGYIYFDDYIAQIEKTLRSDKER